LVNEQFVNSEGERWKGLLQRRFYHGELREHGEKKIEFFAVVKYLEGEHLDLVPFLSSLFGQILKFGRSVRCNPFLSALGAYFCRHISHDNDSESQINAI
jgi:hypothetical protein